jgi:serine/threonine-protein kinase RIO1
MNKRDIEDIASFFERSNSPEEFKQGLIELKEQDLMEQMEGRDLGQ